MPDEADANPCIIEIDIREVRRQSKNITTGISDDPLRDASDITRKRNGISSNGIGLTIDTEAERATRDCSSFGHRSIDGYGIRECKTPLNIICITSDSIALQHSFSTQMPDEADANPCIIEIDIWKVRRQSKNGTTGISDDPLRDAAHITCKSNGISSNGISLTIDTEAERATT